MMKLHMNLAENSYDITVERGALSRIGQLFDLCRRVLVVTDTGVPAEYAETAAAQCKSAKIVTLPMGEGTKTLDSFAVLEGAMTSANFSRRDCVLAVGGGVVGDLSGFAAACYMRGIDFYNVPTTVLSQVDSSIGGKTAVDFGGYKNIVGAFKQPKGVLADPQLLKTLPARQIANGLAEAVKMALTSDAGLFGSFEELSGGSIPDDILDEIIFRSLTVKKAIVEKDEKEQGLRRVLNFGHTLGHGIESVMAEKGLFHGECVALGMLPMCGEETRKRLCSVLHRLSLPTVLPCPLTAVREAVTHDKKGDGAEVTAVFVDAPGVFRFEKITCTSLLSRAEEVFGA